MSGSAVKRKISTPLMLRLKLLTRLKLIFGYRLFIINEIGYAIHEPKPVNASSRCAVLPPWVKTPETLAASEHRI